MNQVIVSFPAQTNFQRPQIVEMVNKTLAPIIKDVSSWNAFVDFRDKGDGSYALIAKCDNDDIRLKMQALLDMKAGRLHAA